MNVICVSDLHGNDVKYRKLCSYIKQKLPDAVLIAGDILPNYYLTDPEDFIKYTLKPLLEELKNEIKDKYPPIYIITGNDDAAISSEYIEYLELKELAVYANSRIIKHGEYYIFGYPYIPPTPFLLKDWEKYDVSRFTPRDCVSPEDGIRTIEVPANVKKFSLIKDDLNEFAAKIKDFSKTICLFHTPPCETNLDRIYANDINGTKEILCVGSYGVRRFIEKFQPLFTVHGHIHESTDISGSWMDKIGETVCINASHSASELAVTDVDTDFPEAAKRVLL